MSFMKRIFSQNEDSWLLSEMTGFCLLGLLLVQNGSCSHDEYRLIEDLFERKDGSYNPRIRPVANLSDKIMIGFEMALVQLINLIIKRGCCCCCCCCQDEKNQIMKTNVWLRLHWCDNDLVWNKADYGDINVFRIQPDKVWKPDIVLTNNADGRFEVSFKANVLVYENGWVMWIPCTIYKSSCNIDVTYFPFDEQTCEMIFSSWTYNSAEVGLKWYQANKTFNYTMVDITNYEASGSWDLIDIPGSLNTSSDKDGRSYDFITYKVKFRRKTLFYTVNLIIPCVLISSLSIILFMLPADAGEKTTLGISILLALVVFLQVLVTNLLPPSSRTFPLFAKYLMFTVLIDVCATFNTIVVLKWNFKTPRTYRMPKWVRWLFFGILPRLLLMKRPGMEKQQEPPHRPKSTTSLHNIDDCHKPSASTPLNTPSTARRQCTKPQELDMSDMHHPDCPHSHESTLRHRNTSGGGGGGGGVLWEGSLGVGGSSSRGSSGSGMKEYPQELNKAIEAVRFISAHLKNEDDYEEIVDDWRYVAQMLDRILLIAYGIASITTLLAILLNAPAIFQTPIDQVKYKEDHKELHDFMINNTQFDIGTCPNRTTN